MRKRLSIYSLSAVVGLGLLGTLVPASASVKGRRNTALALSGAAVYELARGHTGVGLVLAGGSYYAWQKTKAAKRHHRAARVHPVRRVAHRHHRSSRQHRVA
jgi:hypothetical protein